MRVHFNLAVQRRVGIIILMVDAYLLHFHSIIFEKVVAFN